jgi:ParB family chromosome partitioning protein
VDIGAIEAAEAYDRLIKDFGMTQEEVALKVGKSRSAVANLLRLLKLTEEARQALMNGRITEGHARALLLAKTNDQQLDWLERVLTEGLNVRQTEALAKVGEKPLINQATAQPEVTPNPVADALREHLMAPVRIESGAKRGKIVIEFFGEDDLTRIFDRLGIEVR